MPTGSHKLDRKSERFSAPLIFPFLADPAEGGKSDCLLWRHIHGAEQYTRFWNGLIVRRKYKEFNEMRRRLDGLIMEGLPAERIGGDQQISHIRFDNGASIILAAVMRLELINDWVGHQSGLPIADETIEIHKGGRTGKDALVKLIARPTFDGKIKAGKEYKLIDDAIA